MNQPAACVTPVSSPSPALAPTSWTFVPRVRLYMEKLTVDRGEFLRPELHDVEMPVLSVVFDYGGGAEFRACPPEFVENDEDESSEDGTGDWFRLEFGVEVDGNRVNLLPALVEILERAPDDVPLSTVLKRLPARYRAVPVGVGKHLALEPDRLIALLEIVVDLYDG